MNEGKELKAYLAGKIDGYAEVVFNSEHDNETKMRIFYNKLTLLDGYFNETAHTKEWYYLAFNSAVTQNDADAKAFFSI